MHRNHNNEPQSPVAALLVGIFGICFGVFWTIMAGAMAPFMAFFGIFFIAIAVVNTVNVYKTMKNHQKENENYSENQPISKKENEPEPKEIRCPYCGAPIAPNERKCEYCDSEF